MSVLAALSAVLLAGPAAAAPTPPGAVVLPGAQLDLMLHQCSRAAPAKGEATWQPDAADIAAFEALLPAALAPRFPREPRWARAPAGWGRQYIGIVRGGRRFIYGNFFPVEAVQPKSPRDRPMNICDGGPVFFGAEYDVAARRISHLAFNGGV